MNLGSVTRFECNHVKLLAATIDLLGQRTEQTYDAARRPIEVKDAFGNSTTYPYDSGPADELEASPE